MKTIKRSQVYHAPADIVFSFLDDLGITGMHMTQSSAMMMGSKLHLEFLTDHHNGIRSKYRWTGTMLWMDMDFSVEVTKWIEGVEKTWETVGESKMIIYSWYRMHLLVYPQNNSSKADLSMTYEKPRGWFLKIVSFLLADIYCRWCLKKMLADAKTRVELAKEKILTSANGKTGSIQSTNWYVVTGGPGSGKTTTVNLLRRRGYKTTIEHARHYIDTERITGRTVEEIRKNQAAFQAGVLNMQIEQERYLLPEELVFLDRALPDSLAYVQYLNLPVEEQLTKVLSAASYKKIFILDILPLVNDYARVEDKEAQSKIHSLITAVYEPLPFPIVHVPVLPPEERVDFILKHL